MASGVVVSNGAGIAVSVGAGVSSGAGAVASGVVVSNGAGIAVSVVVGVVVSTGGIVSLGVVTDRAARVDRRGGLFLLAAAEKGRGQGHGSEHRPRLKFNFTAMLLFVDSPGQGRPMLMIPDFHIPGPSLPIGGPGDPRFPDG